MKTDRDQWSVSNVKFCDNRNWCQRLNWRMAGVDAGAHCW